MRLTGVQIILQYEKLYNVIIIIILSYVILGNKELETRF